MMVIEFGTALFGVGYILATTRDKKERKKRLLSLAKKCQLGARAFIQNDLLGGTSSSLDEVYAGANERYQIMQAETIRMVNNGVSGVIIYQNVLYPIYINPDSREAAEWARANEYEVCVQAAIEFSWKFDIAPNTKGIVALFQTSGFSGLERHTVFNEQQKKYAIRT